MRAYNWFSLVLISMLLLACGKPLPELNGVDLPSFRTDKNGCKGDRLTMRDAVTGEKDKLLGLNETQIVGLLGRPDQNELYKRNQKFYYYYITQAPSCSNVKSYVWLSIRFNAVGLAKEVVIEEVG